MLHHIPGTRDPLKSAHPWTVLLEATDSCAGKDVTELQCEADVASAEVHRVAAELGGSISAEHGIGGAKRDELKL